MRGILILIGIGVLVLGIAYLLVDTEPAPPGVQPRAIAVEPPPPDEREKPLATADQAARPDGRFDRAVGEDLIAIPDFKPDELERLSPREPLSRPPERKDDTGTRLLHRPVAIAAGLFEAQDYRIRIAGIEVVAPSTICGTVHKRPCGMQALTAFRAWLRGRSIECDLTEPLEDGVIEAPCRLASNDAAAWLVEHGWARAKAGSSYGDLETAARQQEKGIFAR